MDGIIVNSSKSNTRAKFQCDNQNADFYTFI